MLMSSSREELCNCMVPTLKLQSILLPTTRQINALVRARLAERLPNFRNYKVTMLKHRKRCTTRDRAAVLVDRQTSRLLQSGTLVEIVMRVTHVRVFRLVTDFRRKFRVTAMDVRNLGRQQRLIAVVPNWKRKGQDLNETSDVTRRCASRSLPNAIAGSGGITFRLVDLINGRKELSRSDDKVRIPRPSLRVGP